MADVTAQRTLVKSPPELWSELSEVESLARHLGELGEIRITKVEPETTVAWEGEQISGTVELEQSGWGTKVTLNATVPEPDRPAAERNEPAAAAEEPEATEPEPGEPEAQAEEPAAEVDETEAQAEEPAAEVDETAEPEVEARAETDAPRERRPGFWAKMFGRRRGAPEAADSPELPEPPAPQATEPEATEPEPPEPEPEPTREPEPNGPEAVALELEPEPAGLGAEQVRAVLDGTLDSLGQAHHRPFSRG